MNRIAELRKQHGISQEQLAKHLRIAQNTLSQYENERRAPTVRIIEKIAEAFEVSTNYVLGIPDKAPETSTDSSHPLLNVSKVISLFAEKKVNIYLNAGWKLLRVCENFSHNEYGVGHAYPEYVLGWFGDPAKAPTPKFAEAGDEYIEEL